MKKNYKKLVGLLTVLLLCFSFETQAQIATLDMSGNFTVRGTASLWWQYRYKPTGSSTYAYSQIVQGSGTSIIKLNPFISWDFSINYYSFSGQPGPWGSDATVNSEYAAISKSVGYTYDFNSNALTEGWRGYRLQNVTNNYNSNVEPSSYIVNGSSGQSMYMGWGNGYSTMLVSPKITDLSTDKKFSIFAYRNSTSASVILGTMSNPYDPATFHPLKTVYLTNTGFNKIETFLNNYTGSDQYIAIKSNNSNGEVFFDDFAYEQSVNCFDNTNLNVTGVTQSTALVNFTADALQNSWELELKDVTHNITQTLSIASTNYQLQNLTGNTSYQVRIRANCAPGLYSNWTAVQSFSTQCETISSGYQTSFLDNIYFDPCWNKIQSGSDIYQAPIGGNTSIVPRTGSRYIMMVNNTTSTTQKAFIVTPYITDLSNTKRVKFFLVSDAFSDYNDNSLTIGTMSNPNDDATFVPLKTISPLEMNEIGGFEVNDYWKEHIVYLDNYDNNLNHHYIALKQNNIQYSSYFHIDDFTYEATPSCKEPVDLKLVKSGPDSAIVKWENAMDPVSGACEIQYGLTGFTLGTGTTVTAIGSLGTLTNLSSFANYDFYVRSKCGTQYSNWSDRGTFKTKCSGVTSGYTYDFENENFNQNSCWIRNTPRIRKEFYSANAFIRYTDSQSGYFPQPHSGNKMISIFSNPNNLDSMVNEKSILVTPQINDLNNTRKISFWTYMPSNIYGTLVSMQIGTLSDPEDYTTFVPYETITGSFVFDQWKNYVIDFSRYYGTDKHIGIRMFTANSNNYGIFIDDFVYGDNGCARPSALAGQQSGPDSASLNWVTNTNDPVNCEVEYGVLGFTPGTGTVLNATSLPFTINGLNSNTKYQFRVRNVCGTGIVNWSLPYDFKIGCSVTVPYEENFDQYPATNGVYIPNFCWSTNESSIDNIEAGVQNYFLENFNSSPNVAYLRSYNETKSGYLISPFLNDFDTTKRVKFWITTTSQQSTRRVWIGVLKNPLDLTTFEPYQEIILTDLPDYGKEVQIDFSNYQGTGKYVAFKLSGDTSYSGQIMVDDFKYLNQASCVEPVNVQFLNISNNSTLIKWDTTNDATVKVEYGLENFAPGAGNVLTTNQNEILIPGLVENTRYHFYIKTICGQSESLTLGPKTITTTCNPLALPWQENFNQMPAYGQGSLPACMNLVNGQGLFSYNASQSPSTSYFNYDHLLTGIGDTHYLWLKNDKPAFTTPSFNLIAGVTYRFSLFARKAYQYDSQGIKVYVGRGRYFHYMETAIQRIGQLTEYSYNVNEFIFTPIESGSYTFIIEGTAASVNSNMILDNFKLDESYNFRISSQQLFDFENGIVPYELIAENPENSNVLVTTVSGNKKLWLKGATVPLQNTNFTDPKVWVNNQSSISKVNFKIMAGATSPLILKFDLKQTYSSSNNESLFRVIVNGNQVGEIIKPQTSNADGFITYSYDLSAYAASDIYVSLQHLGRSGSGTGDHALLDNIEITNMLAQTNFEWNALKVYPNPTKDLVTIENDEALTAVEVSSINGQVLHTAKLDVAQTKIDLSGYSSGIYFVRVVSNEKQKIIKIVKN